MTDLSWSVLPKGACLQNALTSVSYLRNSGALDKGGLLSRSDALDHLGFLQDKD